MSQPNPDLTNVTIREVYTLLQSAEARVMSELEKLETAVDTRFEKHSLEHQNDYRHRSSLYRWAVTSVVTGIGVLGSIWYTLAHH